MSKKVLDSLEILRFRGFQHLRIEHLGEVNLIVGQNNVGKSSLLEALLLYARRASPIVVQRILGIRDENRMPRPDRNLSIEKTLMSASGVEEALTSARYLFYGRKEIKSPMEPIEIGPIDSAEDKLILNVQWYKKDSNEEEVSTLLKKLFKGISEASTPYEISETSTPRFTIQFGKGKEFNHPIIDLIGSSSRLYSFELDEITCFSIDASGLNRREVGELWDSIALTDREKEVLAALRIVAPGVEDISVIGTPTSFGERVPIVKVTDLDEPLPIRCLGNGMQRILGISLALVNAKDGMLLIDEIENGLHHSVQSDLWCLIFQLAHRLNVQVFATTHSWDCIKAFQHAAQENEQVQGVLIRLEMKDGEFGATLLDKQDLAIATRHQIEVR